MQREHLILAAASVSSAALGAVVGYKYAFKKFYSSYEETVAKEVEEAKRFYANLHKVDYPTPEEAAKTLVPDEDLHKATDALRTYLGQEPRESMEDDSDEGEEVEEVNVFDQGDQLTLDKEGRNTSEPYIVDLDEYMDNPLGHEQTTLSYYEGDNILADERDEIIEKVDAMVGLENLTSFGISDPNEPSILLVRNEKLKMDFEISHSDGKYAYEVLGFEQEIKHSEEPRRRRPQWDD